MDEDLWEDFIMGMTIEAEAPSYELLQACLAARPSWRGRILGFFEAWVWDDWVEANFPPPPEPTPAEEAASRKWAEEAVARALAELERRRRALN